MAVKCIKTIPGNQPRLCLEIKILQQNGLVRGMSTLFFELCWVLFASGFDSPFPKLFGVFKGRQCAKFNDYQLFLVLEFIEAESFKVCLFK